jgi:hypothetical protein
MDKIIGYAESWKWQSKICNMHSFFCYPLIFIFIKIYELNITYYAVWKMDIILVR